VNIDSGATHVPPPDSDQIPDYQMICSIDQTDEMNKDVDLARTVSKISLTVEDLLKTMNDNNDEMTKFIEYTEEKCTTLKRKLHSCMMMNDGDVIKKNLHHMPI